MITNDLLPQYVSPLKKFRILFSNGFVFDCAAIRDDSDMRSWAIVYNGFQSKNNNIKILGVADMGALEIET